MATGKIVQFDASDQALVEEQASRLAKLEDGGLISFAHDDMAALPRALRMRLVDGRYEVEGRIDAGGIGAVYAAFDRKTKRPVAVKLARGGPPRRVGGPRVATIAGPRRHGNL